MATAVDGLLVEETVSSRKFGNVACEIIYPVEEINPHEVPKSPGPRSSAMKE